MGAPRLTPARKSAYPAAVPRRAVLLAALLAPTAARAAPIELVEQRKNFMIFDDVDGSIEHANWYSRDSFYTGFRAVEEGFLANHPDDSDFLVVYSTFKLVQGVGAFYQALANDVAGIGYSHAADFDPVIPAEFFDDTPDSKLYGFLHMNDWRNFLLQDGVTIDDEWISLVFGQELGHAWLAFPHVDLEGAPGNAMLGRSDAHWNFYMHTGGSPVEGHLWTDHGDGSFTATKLDKYQFSDLDLYLMGLMPPEEVQPWFLIEDPHDCIDSNLRDMECAPASAHGFKADQYRVKGTRRDITVADVISREGARTPAYPDAPNEWSLSFLLIKRPDETLCDDEIAVIDEVIDRSLTQWIDQTRGRANLINRTRVEDVPPAPSCDGDTTTGAEPDTTTGPADTGSSGETVLPTTDDAPPDGSTTAEEPTTSTTAGQIDDAGCGCRGSAPASLVPLLALVWRRRRRP